MNLLLALTISEWAGFLMYMIITGAIIKHPDSLAFLIYLFYYIVSLIITFITYLLVESSLYKKLKEKIEGQNK